MVVVYTYAPVGDVVDESLAGLRRCDEGLASRSSVEVDSSRIRAKGIEQGLSRKIVEVEMHGVHGIRCARHLWTNCSCLIVEEELSTQMQTKKNHP